MNMAELDEDTVDMLGNAIVEVAEREAFMRFVPLQMLHPATGKVTNVHIFLTANEEVRELIFRAMDLYTSKHDGLKVMGG